MTGEVALGEPKEEDRDAVWMLGVGDTSRRSLWEIEELRGIDTLMLWME